MASRHSLDEGKMPRASKWALRLPVKSLIGALLGAARGSAGRVLVDVEDWTRCVRLVRLRA
jgi:hypothetical protein